MKRSIGIFQLWGFAFTSLAGTLLHFLYDFANKAIWAAPFSAVNESTWEHMKLLFFPALLYAIFESFFFCDRADFFCIKLRGILLGLILIPVLFYTYNGAIGKSPDWINITIFFVSAAIAYIFETRLFASGRAECRSKNRAIALLVILALLFVIFTFQTPTIGIFKDPISGGYGI